MATIKTYHFTREDIESVANTIKEAIFRKLEQDNVLDKGVSEKLSSKYIVLAITKKGILGKIIDKIYNIDDDKISFLVVKMD